jgi:hypothetical protein
MTADASNISKPRMCEFTHLDVMVITIDCKGWCEIAHYITPNSILAAISASSACGFAHGSLALRTRYGPTQTGGLVS